MAPERPRLVLTKLALAYAVAGSLLGTVFAAIYSLGVIAITDAEYAFHKGLAREILSFIGSMWLIGLAPAALASLSLCLVMRFAPSVYTDRRRRVGTAAACSVVACFLSWFFFGSQYGSAAVYLKPAAFLCAIGLMSGAALAYLLARPQHVPSNISLQRDRYG